MRSLVISSNCSGGGKTTITLGIMKAIKERGYEVQGYKVGPDYIDPAFHKQVTGKPSRNLDLFLMGEEGVKAAYSRGRGDFGVVEGVMGLYDGKGITSEYSTAHLAKTLDLPIVLVITPKAQSVTLCAELNGIVDFQGANIIGVILNNVTESYYDLLKLAIEKNCKLKIFGYIPKTKELELKSRHLGLVQSSEVEDIDKKIQLCSELLEKYVDMDSLIESFKVTETFVDNFHLEKQNIRIAIARDKAFSFYYTENLELLEEVGEVVYFSPIKDKILPENIDFLYIGGGYPEVFIEELSSNKTMLESIKTALEGGLRCYAECGGLMYLTETIDGKATVGFYKGQAYMGSKLQNFGYAQINYKNEDLRINCHEFHRSFVELMEKTVYNVDKTVYNFEKKQWACGYLKNNTLAAYGHVHFFGNLEFIKRRIGE